MIKKVFIIFSGLLLIYMLWPGPSKISQFKPLPDSAKSTLSGDTVQIPNVSAYFSNNYRQFSTSFYRQQYNDLTKLPFFPLRLNYPPEFAFIAIKDQTHSTYLEEFVYPLRNSLFINGFEPVDQNDQPRFKGAAKIEVDGSSYNTKATLRFYYSPIWVRILTWIGIVVSTSLLWKISRKVLWKERIF